MQKLSCRFNDEDRRIVRRWRLASVGFYGSILAGLAISAAFHQSPDVDFVSAQSAAVSASRDNPRHR
jgi:multisubunit Na+/H+ antiporter MnhB subunit